MGRGGFYKHIEKFNTDVHMVFDDINRAEESMLMELVSEYVERDYEIIDRYVGVIRENKNKIAGCLVQWYEIKLIEEYLQSLKNALDQIDNKKNVVVDILFNLNQELEKVDTEKSSISDIRKEFYKY